MGHLERRARYRNDPNFHRLVHILYGMIDHAGYLPEDVLDAAMLAGEQWYEKQEKRPADRPPGK
jgi:hypothetical protein